MVAPRLRQARQRSSRPHPYQLTLAAEISGVCVADIPRGQRARALAGCVILDAGGRVLLLHRKGARAQWELPGGKVERGESVEDAARREVGEELGVLVGETAPLGDTRFHACDGAWRYTWYLALEVAGTPTISERNRFDGLAFFSLGDLVLQMDEVSPNVKRFVASYYEGQILLPPRAGEHRQST